MIKLKFGLISYLLVTMFIISVTATDLFILVFVSINKIHYVCQQLCVLFENVKRCLVQYDFKHATNMPTLFITASTHIIILRFYTYTWLRNIAVQKPRKDYITCYTEGKIARSAVFPFPDQHARQKWLPTSHGQRLLYCLS